MSKEEKKILEKLKDNFILTTSEQNKLANLIDRLQKNNKELNLENQALYESINCNDDNMLARRYEKLQKENEEIKEKYSRKLIDFQKEREEYEKELEQEKEKNKALVLHDLGCFVEGQEKIKDKIKEIKEKIHWLLDKNGITRAYQLEIDRYFEDLLKEN